MKTCKKCNVEKETTEYYNQKRYKDGLDPMCIECRKKTSKEYHDAHRVELREKSSQWRKENVERDKLTKRAYYLKNKEKFKQYYKKKITDEVRD
jgi:hypothetical protein